MRILDPGHTYEVQNVDGSGVQIIQFVKRRGPDGELLAEHQRREGIQTQELLRVAINRSIFLNGEQCWHENVDAVNHLRDALRLYESRAAHRALDKLAMPELASACSICHHIFCHHQNVSKINHGEEVA